MAEHSSPEVQARSWRLSRVFTDRTITAKTSATAAVGLVGMLAQPPGAGIAPARP